MALVATEAASQSRAVAVAVFAAGIFLAAVGIRALTRYTPGQWWPWVIPDLVVGVTAAFVITFTPLRRLFGGGDRFDRGGRGNGGVPPPGPLMLLVVLIVIGNSSAFMGAYTMGTASRLWQSVAIVLGTATALLSVPGVFGLG